MAGGGGGPKWHDKVEVKGRKILGLGSAGGKRQSFFSEFLDKEESNSSQPSPVVQTSKLSTLMLPQELYQEL